MALYHQNYLDYYWVDTDADKTGLEATLGDGAIVWVLDANRFYKVVAGAYVETVTASLTNTTQTIAGAKTFSSTPTFSTMTAGSVLFAGTAGILSQNNTNFFYDNSNTILRIGGATTALSTNTLNPFQVTGTSTAYLATYIQNKSNNVQASTDITAGNDTDDGTILTGHYIDAGINSSTWDGSSGFTVVGANGGYFYCAGGDIAIGTITNTKNLVFFTGGTTTSSTRLLINGSGNIVTGASKSTVFRQTNAGANINSNLMVEPTGSVSNAAAFFMSFDTTNGLVFGNPNGTRRIERAAIIQTSTSDSAGSETGVLTFYTKPSGAAVAQAFQLTETQAALFSGTASPVSNDGAALGTTSLSWSDLFLASGAVLNYANGNVVVTHTSGILTMGTGTFKITNPTNTTTSVVTIDGTQTLTNKTIDGSQLVANSVTYAKMQQASAQTMIANNTNGTANFVEQAFYDVPIQTYGGTISWNGTAPTTIVSQQYSWSRLGNTVTLIFGVEYTNAGTTNTSATVTLPTDCPSPATLAGWGDAASEVICNGSGSIEASATAAPSAARVFLNRNAANNGYVITVTAGSTSAKVLRFTMIYRTA